MVLSRTIYVLHAVKLLDEQICRHGVLGMEALRLTNKPAIHILYWRKQASTRADK